jgi:hypothetical protein
LAEVQTLATGVQTLVWALFNRIIKIMIINDEDQLFQLLSQFKSWQDGDSLSELRLVQHDLVLAHLARLYGNISWNAQVFGLCSPYQLILDIQQDRPKALSKLLAVTATGKLMVCDKADIPDGDNSNHNNGLFAIARPYPLPKALEETLPKFPLYQVQLEWRAWQSGINEIVETGEGIPLGRSIDGQWDKQYIPPTVSVAASDDLLSRLKKIMVDVEEIMANVEGLKEFNLHIQVLLLEINSKNYSKLTPSEFWLAHSRCLIMLQQQILDETYTENLSNLLEGFRPWDFGACLAQLEICWRWVINKKLKKNLNKAEQLKPRTLFSGETQI